MRHAVEFVLNGAPVAIEVEPWGRLLDLLRGPLGHTGTKEGCGSGECGACTVLVDGRSVNACLYPAPEVDGRRIVTIEGLAPGAAELTAVQRAFVEEGGIQCGYCTPGMILSALALLERDGDPSDDEIRDGLAGNLCRCTGYAQIVDAVRRAAELRRKAPAAGEEAS